MNQGAIYRAEAEGKSTEQILEVLVMARNGRRKALIGELEIRRQTGLLECSDKTFGLLTSSTEDSGKYSDMLRKAGRKDLLRAAQLLPLGRKRSKVLAEIRARDRAALNAEPGSVWRKKIPFNQAFQTRFSVEWNAICNKLNPDRPVKDWMPGGAEHSNVYHRKGTDE